MLKYYINSVANVWFTLKIALTLFIGQQEGKDFFETFGFN